MAPGRRTKRFDDPCSEVVWRAILTLDVGPQYELLRELATLFAADGSIIHATRSNPRAAVRALHQAAEILGHPPSIKEYRSLRIERPELRLPSDANVRRWLGGGWNDCLRRALLEAVSDGDFASRAAGLTFRYRDEEVFAALRECRDDLGHAPTLSEYCQWSRRPDVLARPGRRPRSLNVFQRCGGFRAALAKAGVIGEREARFAADGRPLPIRYSYTREDMIGALRGVARLLGRSPRPTDY